MPVNTGGRLADMAWAFRDDLEQQTAASVAAMLDGWVTAQERLAMEVDLLLSKIEAARLAGAPVSPAWLYQEQRLSALTDQVAAEIDHWAPMAEREAREAAYAASRAARANAQALTREAARTSLPGLEAAFLDLSPENMASILGHLAPGGPLRDLLHRLAGETSRAASDVLLQGVLLGKGIPWMRQGLTRTLGIPAWRAETIARTEALRAYRETSRQTYIQSNVVGSWTWLATIDRRTCSSCIVMSGTHHPLTETLDDHPRGRCAMVPRTKSWEEILGADLSAGLEDTRVALPLGRDWLARQSPAVQSHYLGPGKAKALQAGDITMDDLVARTSSPEWGTMRRERSMLEIREGRNANWTEPITPTTAAPAQAPRLPADWDRWETGRETHVGKAGTTTEVTRARENLERARTYADQDAAQAADFAARLKERQAELRRAVPDAAERRRISRTDHTLQLRKQNLETTEKMAAQSRERLAEAEAEWAKVSQSTLPDFNPANPLEFYGDRVTIYDRSPSTLKHLEELENDIAQHHHELLRDHYAESVDGGFFVGDRYITDMDGLGIFKGQQPRGWPDGSTFDQVPGVYSPSTRVCACGGDGKGHGSTSLVLHEGGHALDDAYGTQGVGGTHIRASATAEYQNAYDSVSPDVRRDWNPYYRVEGNPTGYLSEAWAEGFAGWTKVRNLSLSEQARAIAKALTGRGSTSEQDLANYVALARYYASLV